MDDQNLPELNQNTYVKETALALWEGFPRILVAGLLFTLVSVPAMTLYLLGFTIAGLLVGVVSAGPGCLAMCAVIARTLLREPVSFWGYWQAFGHYFKRGLVLAALIEAPILAASLTLPVLQNPQIPTLIWVGLGADLAGLFFLAVLYQYTLPQIVIYDIRIGTAFKNSLLMASRHMSNTLGLFGMAVLLAMLAAWVNFLLWAVFLACWMTFVINNCRMVIQQETGRTE